MENIALWMMAINFKTNQLWKIQKQYYYTT